MIKLIVTDIDGTLVDDKQRPPADLFEVTARLLGAGYHLAVASGRQLSSLEKIFEPFQREMSFIADNGAIVEHRGEVIYHYAGVSPVIVEKIISECELISNVCVIICGLKSSYVLWAEGETLNFIKAHYPKLVQISNFSEISDIVLKISVFDEKLVTENSLPYMLKFDGYNGLRIVTSGDNWIDITDGTINKGKALSFLQERLNISIEDTAAFGDYDNDIEMMGRAYYSYAMKNAQQSVIDVANFITDKDNNNNGVIDTLRRRLIRKIKL